MRKTHTSKQGVIVDGKSRSIEMRIAEHSYGGSSEDRQHQMSATDINNLYLEMSGRRGPTSVWPSAGRPDFGAAYPASRDVAETAARATTIADRTTEIAERATQRAAHASHNVWLAQQQCTILRGRLSNLEETYSLMMRQEQQMHTSSPSSSSRSRQPSAIHNDDDDVDDYYDADESEPPEDTHRY